MSVNHRKIYDPSVILRLIIILILAAGSTLSQDVLPGSEIARGTQGMVATAHPLASQAALEMLKQGGNAVDAAVAAAFAIGVVEPDGSGLGGGGGMVIYLNREKESYYINYYQRASENVGDIDYDPDNDRLTAKSILVPGTVAGLTMALENFGTLSLNTVLEPAIRYAEEGFPLDNTLAQILLDNTSLVEKNPATAEVFLEEGFPRMEGDTLRQPGLAATLKEIARNGCDGFYKGHVAETIVGEIRRRGGVITMNDFKNYRAILTKPLEADYRGYKIITANAPQSGVSVLQSLNMLERTDLAKMGHYSQSARSLHLMAETFRRSYADRWTYLGDPEYIHVPLTGMISDRYATERFMEINQYKADPRKYRETAAGNPAKYDSEKTVDDQKAITPATDKTYFDDENEEGKSSYDDWGEDMFDSWGKKKKKVQSAGSEKTPPGNSDTTTKTPGFEEEFDGHTTHLSVIDRAGNMVSLTQTLGTFFGSGITAGGVLLNCGMSNFSRTSLANVPQPGKQPRSSIAPTVVLKNDKPFMLLGSPGASRIICTVVELIVNAIDFGMDINQANLAPRFYCQKFEDYLYLENGISENVQNQLEKMGHALKVYNARDLFFGGAQLIYIDPVDGIYYGSADIRRGGVAIGF
nr:gamma-glutamyltransferase family protein [candidate division Zixibacteria bacterium]